MLVLTHSTAVIWAVFIVTGAVSGEDVKKAVGETVSFSPDKLESPVTSITWKHVSLATVKAIEWDVDDGVIIPNQRFKGITTLDEKTGKITITNLKVEHSGEYTIDINSKEQGQRFSLEVMERVPKPKITVEESGNPDVVYLRCEFSGTIIWTNLAGETLEGNKNHKPGEFITVKNTRNPENYYTCTLKNAVSEKTSDRVYERELFKTDSAPWWIFVIVLLVLILLAAPFVLYKVCDPFHKCVFNNFKGKPCIGDILNCLDGEKKSPGTKGEDNALKSSSDAENGQSTPLNAEKNTLTPSSDAENVEENDYVNTEKDGDKREGAENSNEPLKADSDGGEQVAKL